MENLREEFKWCRYTWETCMESNRPIHPDYPNNYYNKKCVYKDLSTNDIVLNIAYGPKKIIWWDKTWKNKVEYNPTIACGLIKTVETIPVNNSIECEVLAPTGPNLWFSFWLTACDNWPPEIDIFEGYTDENSSYFDKLKFHWKFPFIYRDVRMESNVHYKKDKGVHKSTTAKGEHKSFFNLPLQDCWNNFKCNWYEDKIEFYINGKLHRVITDKKVLSKMKTEGMWAIFNIYPGDKFNYSVNRDIQKFGYSYRIRDFKVTKLK